ncbi:MAG: hypothetical protein AAFR20_03500 [Pseudomonadota bacterium]
MAASVRRFVETFRMRYLKCGTHGRQPETYVCVHLVETVADGEPRGFWWSYEDGAFEAICSVCNDLEAAAFQAAMVSQMRGLCYGCFRVAADVNGIVLDEVTPR